jgi:hypothetical protein
MSPRERKTREQRAAETQATLDEIDAKRAASASQPGRGFVRQTGRDFAEETVWLLIQLGLFLVPCAVGLLLGPVGLALGFVVGLLLVGVFWVVVTVTGLRAARDLRRQARS